MKGRRKVTGKARIYDAEGYTQRAGCLCFRTEEEKEVLLVTSNRFPDQWIVPSGGVEHRESFQDAALREVLEEAGVCGAIQRSLGIFQNDSNMSRTAMFTLIVKQEFDVWEEAVKGRRREWFPVERAFTLLSIRPSQQSYLGKAINWSSAQENQARNCHRPCHLSSSMTSQWNISSTTLC